MRLTGYGYRRLAGARPRAPPRNPDGYADVLTLLEVGADSAAVDGQAVMFQRYLFTTCLFS
ncbi:hypothetical protein ABZV91_11075 [Nocardia sp. NPDC004568]|uniref:hypothetical protein n=1 Tax=Nocardia sp. NPDC004568 TaxID=3154551 RepID=UPI0033A2DFB9